MRKYQMNNEVIYSEVNDEVILLDTRSGSYIGMNESAKLILEGLITLGSEEEVIDSVCMRTEASYETVSSAVFRFRDQLIEKKYIEEA